MAVFSLSDFADHEQVVFVSDDKSGLKAIIAVHNSNLGPALGGCRMWPYASEEEAVRDVLRLSRGMTYKSAMARLKLGGGKSVIIGNPRTDKTPALLAAFARALEQLNGRYIAAEDSGTSVADMKFMTQFTQHVAGIHDKPSDEGTRSGDPSPATAYGTFIGIQAAVKERLGRDSLDGLRVAVQGVGNVGYDLARQLKEAGAQLWVTDIHREPLVQAGRELGATVVAPDEIFGLDVDVFAPCALGAVLNDSTIPQLKASIVAAVPTQRSSCRAYAERSLSRSTKAASPVGMPSSKGCTNTPLRRASRQARTGPLLPAANDSSMLTPTAGIPRDSASPRADATEMRMPVKLPGPMPTPMALRSPQPNPASASSRSSNGNNCSA